MKYMKLVWLGVAALVYASVAGCAGTGGYRTPEYRLARGSVIELMQTLTFPSGSSRTYIQGGKPQHWNDLNLWKPYCSFGLDTSRDHKPRVREIHPTKFTTGDTRLGVQAALDPNNSPSVNSDGIFAGEGVKIARNSRSSGERTSGFPSRLTFYTTITLYSDEEPQVADLTCAFSGLPTDRNLTLAQIQATLGSIVKIQ